MTLSLGKKIALGQIAVFFIFCTFALFVFIYTSSIKNSNLVSLRNNFAQFRYSQNIKLHVVQVQQFLTDISATRGEDGLDGGLKEAEENYNLLQKNIEQSKKLAMDTKDQSIAKSLEEIKQYAETYYNSGIKMANLYIKQGTAAGNAYMVNFDQDSLNLQERVDKLLVMTSGRFSGEIEKITQAIAFILTASIWIPLAAILLFTLSSVIFIKKITAQIFSVTDELKEATPRLIDSADSMSSLSTELSSCATEQAAAIQETAATLEEISAMIGRNSENANRAKDSSRETIDSVKRGQEALSDMLNAMEQISENNEAFNDFMTQNNAELNEIVHVISNIAEKTKVINDIVFQTKLLSFNASVEAARAGEQGKGFAVVAEEIGSLAQMSGNAANEIKVQLDDSISKVNNIVSSTKIRVQTLISDGKEKVKMGTAKAQQCDAVLGEINNTSLSSEAMVSEVAYASKEQSLGIEEVSKAMKQIDEVTSQNTMASQSVSSSAAQVMQLSTGIQSASEKLLVLIKG